MGAQLIKQKKTVQVACVRWDSCKWEGSRRVWHRERTLAPCPRCHASVVVVLDAPVVDGVIQEHNDGIDPANLRAVEA